MRTLQINYDLKKPGRNYQPVYDYIKKHSWCRPVQSCWFIRTSKTPSQVVTDLSRLIDANDEVLVLDVTHDSWATNFKDTATAWMHENMSTAPIAA